MAKIRNPILTETIFRLRKASSKGRYKIWEVAAEYLSKHRSRRPCVNIGKISRLTKEGDRVLVPGRVLGGGVIDHGIIIGAYSFTESAKRKILKAGGEALHILEFVEKYPDGSGVILIGG
ncbi:MAG: 50S ribosomal protein L18e [Nitrososphaerota archaeon]|nr:50S ribosomal protein L18e [Nitrososphaerales archaeon]MDW8044403.1 50S ribosomal protein L18e [Nitrososphaerota archaeon]